MFLKRMSDAGRSGLCVGFCRAKRQLYFEILATLFGLWLKSNGAADGAFLFVLSVYAASDKERVDSASPKLISERT